MSYIHAVLDVSHRTYLEIASKLNSAGYDIAFQMQDNRVVINMHGIALRSEPATELEAQRVGSDVLCICGRPYKSHPLAVEYLSYDGYAYLHRLCDGRLVKL